MVIFKYSFLSGNLVKKSIVHNFFTCVALAEVGPVVGPLCPSVCLSIRLFVCYSVCNTYGVPSFLHTVTPAVSIL